jgi:hypothetical protein
MPGRISWIAFKFMAKFNLPRAELATRMIRQNHLFLPFQTFIRHSSLKPSGKRAAASLQIFPHAKLNTVRVTGVSITRIMHEPLLQSV